MCRLLDRASLTSRSDPTPSTAPRYDPDLDLLRDPREPSRYVCVYPMGRDRYRARVLKRLNIGTAATQVEAARLVLAFYRYTFGTHWKQAFRRRKVNPCRIRRIKKGWDFVYVADVFVDGRPIRVSLADTRFFTGATLPSAERVKHTQRLSKSQRDQLEVYCWATREAAREAIKQFLHHQLGLFAKVRAWRQ